VQEEILWLCEAAHVSIMGDAGGRIAGQASDAFARGGERYETCAEIPKLLASPCGTNFAALWQNKHTS